MVPAHCYYIIITMTYTALVRCTNSSVQFSSVLLGLLFRLSSLGYLRCSVGLFSHFSDGVWNRLVILGITGVYPFEYFGTVHRYLMHTYLYRTISVQ